MKPSVAYVAEEKFVASFSRPAFLAGHVTVAVDDVAAGDSDVTTVLCLINDGRGYGHYLGDWSHLPRWRFGGGPSPWSLGSSRRGGRWSSGGGGGGGVPRGHDGSRDEETPENGFWLVRVTWSVIFGFFSPTLLYLLLSKSFRHGKKSEFTIIKCFWLLKVESILLTCYKTKIERFYWLLRR